MGRNQARPDAGVLCLADLAQRLGRPLRLDDFPRMPACTTTPRLTVSPIWAAERDPRITRIGRFVRCTRIDELPS
jgi:lipopolysaccharide/colanic/teichoic acid biosynthesis glycosyltransferase